MHSLLPDDPKQVGKYTLLGRLGQGPRGIVYLGWLSEEAQVPGPGDPAETAAAGDGQAIATRAGDGPKAAAAGHPTPSAGVQAAISPAAAGQPAEQATAGQPAEQATAGQPAEQATAGQPAEESVAGPGEPAETPLTGESEPAETPLTGEGKPAETPAASAAESAEAPRAAGPARRFVIKLLPPWPEADPATRARVVDDLAAARRVSSAYTARTVDAGWVGDRAYVVREHVEGRSLREAVEADGPQTGDALERTAVGTLTALTAIHLAGLAHRGLTPDNVLLGIEGPRVADFGLGETAYRSPEQVRGEPAGPAADVFAWAATMAYAGTGREPFGDSAEAIVTARPDLDALPVPLRDVVTACLAKMPAQRPTAQGAMLWLLGEEKATPPAPAIPASPVPGARPVPAAGDPPLSPPDGATVRVPPHAVVPLLPEGEAEPVWAVPPQPQPPTPQVWGAPALPEDTHQKALPAGSGHVPSSAAPPRKKTGAHFPVGLAAGVGVVIGLSGLGLWGAGHYSATENIGRVAAEGKVTGAPTPTRGLGSVDTADTPPPRPQVTVPWATSPAPQDTGVYPLQITTAPPSIGVPTLSPGPQFSPPPIPSAVPTTPLATPSSSATPAPTVTLTVTPSPEATPTAEGTPPPSDPSQTPAPSGTGSPTPEATPSGGSTPTPTPSGQQSPAPSGTPVPSPTLSAPASPTPSRSRKPTFTKTPIWRPTTTSPVVPKPVVTKTVTARPSAPTSLPNPTGQTSRPPTSNLYTPQKVCDSAGRGTGFSIQRSGAFNGGVTYQLYNAATGFTCVVTMKTQYLGTATPVSATLEVQGVTPVSQSGSFKYYAGPVLLQGKGKCVSFSGSTATGSTHAPLSNCG
jgi:serine/threonine protein kinase